MTGPQMLDTSDLTALADGSLTGHRRTRLEERLAHAPELRRELARQRVAVVALRSVDIAAPAHLQVRIESLARWSNPV
jgi:anti-sigma factor RsiW